MNTPKPYPEIAVFIVLMVVGFMMLILLTLHDHKSMDKFCAENPPQCMPAIYPGKVIEND
jgi:hypothetical protein